MTKTEEYWKETFRKCDAWWVHNGTPTMPHALYTKGGHAAGYFNSQVVQGAVLREATEDLLETARTLLAATHVQHVFGPREGAVPLVKACGSILKVPCVFTKQVEEGGQKSTLIETGQNLHGQTVLPFEDTISTARTIQEAISALEEMGAIVLPLICALVNRLGEDQVGGRKIVALVNEKTTIWAQDECPLCPESKALRPKPNWHLFMPDA